MQYITKTPSDPKYELIYTGNDYQIDTYFLQRRKKYKQENTNKRTSKLHKFGVGKFLLDKVKVRIKKR